MPFGDRDWISQVKLNGIWPDTSASCKNMRDFLRQNITETFQVEWTLKTPSLILSFLKEQFHNEKQNKQRNIESGQISQKQRQPSYTGSENINFNK